MSFLTTCVSSSDCASLQYCLEGECVVKELFPLTLQEILGTFLIACTNSLGSASGIGGGALIVPYFVLIFQRSATQSINYAYAVVFGGSLGNYINIAFIRDPITKASAINYDINLLVLPMLMIGVVLGGFVHLVISDLILYTLLISILVYTIIKNFIQYRRHSVHERQRFIEKGEPNHLSDRSFNQSEIGSFDLYENQDFEEDFFENNANVAEGNLLVRPDAKEQTEEGLLQDGTGVQVQSNEVSNMDQVSLFPWSRFKEIILLLFLVISLGLLRGGKNSSVIGIQLCSSGYWFFTAGTIVVFSILYLRNFYLTRRWQKELIHEGHRFRKNEIIFTRRKCFTIGGTSLIAGLLGATVGIGGAMVIGPRLLDYHMPPKYSTSTTSFFVIFTMFGAILQTLVYGHLKIAEIAWFAGFSFICSYSVSLWVTKFIRKTGKQSFALILLLTSATVSLLIIIIIVALEATNQWNKMKMFNHLCAV